MVRIVGSPHTRKSKSGLLKSIEKKRFLTLLFQINCFTYEIRRLAEQALLAKANGKRPVGLDLDGPITLRILDGVA